MRVNFGPVFIYSTLWSYMAWNNVWAAKEKYRQKLAHNLRYQETVGHKLIL